MSAHQMMRLWVNWLQLEESLRGAVQRLTTLKNARETEVLLQQMADTANRLDKLGFRAPRRRIVYQPEDRRIVNLERV